MRFFFCDRWQSQSRHLRPNAAWDGSQSLIMTKIVWGKHKTTLGISVFESLNANLDIKVHQMAAQESARLPAEEDIRMLKISRLYSTLQTKDRSQKVLNLQAPETGSALARRSRLCDQTMPPSSSPKLSATMPTRVHHF